MLRYTIDLRRNPLKTNFLVPKKSSFYPRFIYIHTNTHEMKMSKGLKKYFLTIVLKIDKPFLYHYIH